MYCDQTYVCRRFSFCLCPFSFSFWAREPYWDRVSRAPYVAFPQIATYMPHHTTRAERKRKRETSVVGKGVFPPPPPPPPWGGSAAAAAGKWRRRMREVRRGRGSQHLPTFTARLHPPREGRGERGEGGGRTAKHGNERGPPHKVGKVVGPTPMSPPFIRCIFSSSGGGGAVLTRLQNERWVEMGSRQ